MKIIDIIIVLLILLGAYLGYKKGLLIEILTFFAFIIAIISAFKLMHLAVSYFSSEGEETESLLPYVAFVLIFIIVFFSIFLLSKLLKNIIDYSLLGSFDNWAGAILGACKMAFGISLFLWLTYHAKIKFPENIVTDTTVYPQLIPFAPKVVTWVSHVIPFQDIFPLIKQSLKG